MKVEKLELVHLAPYLIHRLIMQTPKGDMQLTDLCSLNTRKAWFNTREASLGRYIPLINSAIVEQYNCTGFGFFLVQIAPYLRPLSSLTKEITHNGETFVPIVELAKIAEKDHFVNSDLTVRSGKETHGVGWIDENGTGYAFAYCEEHNGFYLKSKPYTDLIVGSQQLLFQKLYEWKFDINGLIDSGLAIPITN